MAATKGASHVIHIINQHRSLAKEGLVNLTGDTVRQHQAPDVIRYTTAPPMTIHLNKAY